MAQPTRSAGNSVLTALDGQKSTAFLFRLTLLHHQNGANERYNASETVATTRCPSRTAW